MHMAERDIPTEPRIQSLLHDETAQPTHVPSGGVPAPLPMMQSADDVIRHMSKKKNRAASFDNLFDEAKLPILLSMLYFVFQMPCTKELSRRVAPFMYGEDMNANTVGMVVHSVVFALCTLVLIRMQDQIVDFFV